MVGQASRAASTLSTLSFGRRFREVPTTSSAISTHLFQTRSAEKQRFFSKFKTFLYNRQQHTVCNRTGKSWLLISTYYICFLAIIFGMFFGVTYGCLKYLRKTNSPWIDRSLMVRSGGPGVYFFPNIAEVQLPLIWYTIGSSSREPNVYVQYLEEHFKTYTYIEMNKNNFNCSSGDNKQPCSFNTEDLGPCGVSDYGYTSENPCFYLKLAKIYNWIPDYYDEPLPIMPQSLQEVINNSTSKKFVWVHCEGHAPYDKDHVGTFSYYPQQGFSGSFFPYKGQENYFSPIVAVRATNIKRRK